MTKARSDGLIFFVLGSAMFLSLGYLYYHFSPTSMADFRGQYYGARCLLQHLDPYREADLQRVFQAEHLDYGASPEQLHRVVTLYVNLPASFLLSTPFALLPWGPAHFLWMIAIALSTILAAFLMWDLGAGAAPAISGGLIAIFLAGSELLIEIGNAAGIVVSLCVIAVWCFLKDRFVPAGVLCFALSLAIKPHVAGPVWLFFLLAGGLYRKRALQTLVVTAVLSLSAVFWVWLVAPHWMAELDTNLHTISVHGNLNDPGPAGVDPRMHGAISISLQTVVSVFRDDPRFYNPITYLLCAPLLLVWAIVTLRRRFSQESAWLALASIAALSMLPLYHRLHDTGLLLLVFPAFAMLWAGRGATAWLALLFTGAGTLVISDIFVQQLAIHSAHLLATTSGLPGQLLTLVLVRPVPLVLLAMGVFYLWVYVRHTVPDTPKGQARRVAHEFIPLTRPGS
ncbi:MAG: glycosyltransferase family 87 protein [Terracidiphilus sp.]